MKIKKTIIDLMSQKSKFIPYEIGGILGIENGAVVDCVEFDIPKSSKHPCTYIPDINYLNSVIEKWSENDIEFIGMFHTHFANVDTLSVGDKKYINYIMMNMPADIDKLYFPIFVLPNEYLKLYSASLINGAVYISEDKYKII